MTQKKTIRHFRWSILIIIVVIITAIVLVRQVPITQKKTALRDLGYSEEAIEIILEKDYFDILKEHDYYSQTLERVILEGNFHQEYLGLYYEVDDKNIIERDLLLYSRLLDLGYDNLQLNAFFKNLDFWEITPLLVFDYQWNEELYI